MAGWVGVLVGGDWLVDWCARGLVCKVHLQTPMLKHEIVRKKNLVISDLVFNLCSYNRFKVLLILFALVVLATHIVLKPCGTVLRNLKSGFFKLLYRPHYSH